MAGLRFLHDMHILFINIYMYMHNILTLHGYILLNCYVEFCVAGHVAGFSDPMVDCKKTRLRFRADQVFWGRLVREAGETAGMPQRVGRNISVISTYLFILIDDEVVCYVSVMESDTMLEEATKSAVKKAKSLDKKGPFRVIQLKDLTEAASEEYHLIPSPASGEPGDLTPPRDCNLMFQTSVGAVAGDSSVAYLRPETAQGIFTNFMNIQRTARMKVSNQLEWCHVSAPI